MRRGIAAILAGAMMLSISGNQVYASGIDTEMVAGAEETNETESLPEDPEYFKYVALQVEGYRLYSASSAESAEGAESTGYEHDSRFADYTVCNGIDVSYYQNKAGEIDWNAVKESGIEFVFVRVAYRGYGNGTLVVDPEAEGNLKGAAEAGLKVGAYIFSQAITVDEAKEEAKFAIEQVKNHQITMPIVMDFEYVANGKGRLALAELTKEQATDIVNAFGAEVRAQGYEPMIYANSSMLQNDLNAKDILYKIWLAHYTEKTNYPGDYEFWQYTSKGSVPGISGNVDCNFWYVGAMDSQTSDQIPENGWYQKDGEKYWYDNGVMARDKEVYDPSTDAWYWFDADGTMARNKDVFVPTNEERTEGKWVRYNADGSMVKGWNEKDGNRYYFDYTYGVMVKGYATIDGKEYYFNQNTGVLERDFGEVPEMGWKTIDGNDYWYENYLRQGYSADESYRGKEIYDPASDAWYWLDNVDTGKKAVSKDVYQESEAGEWGDYAGEDGKLYGKWVRYDENGHMIKGWNTNENGTYYFDYIYGTMAKGYATIDGKRYYFNEVTGICEGERE